MADPVTMAAISIGASVIGGGVSAFGAGTSANASASAFQYKAGIAQMNAQIAKQNAAWVTNSGGVKANEEGLRDAQEIGQTRTNQGASNIDVGSGSHAAVTTAQSNVARYNQGIIRANAAHTAYGYETQAAADTAESRLSMSAASGASTAGTLGILSSIIGTAGSVASKWTQGSTIGIGSGSGPIGIFDPNAYGAAPTWSS